MYFLFRGIGSLFSMPIWSYIIIIALIALPVYVSWKWFGSKYKHKKKSWYIWGIIFSQIFVYVWPLSVAYIIYMIAPLIRDKD